MSDVEFNRAEPKPVPQKWREQAEAYIFERENYYKSEEFANLDDPRAPVITIDEGMEYWSRPKVWTILKREEVFSYFETVLTYQYLSDAVYDPNRARSSEDELARTFTDVHLLRSFGEWWLRTYTSYPIFTIENVRSLLWTSTDDALVAYLKGGSIDESYALMEEAVSYEEKYVADEEAKRLEGAN